MSHLEDIICVNPVVLIMVTNIGGSSTPIARAAAQASGRPAGLFLPLFHMYLI
jgi:hypothetical protein